YTSTYYPDAIDVGGAQRIAVGSGQELGGLDFALRAVRTHVVAGLLVDAAGPPLTSARVRLTPTDRGAVVEGDAAPVRQDGTFQFEKVLPGTYMVTVEDEVAAERWLVVMRQVTVLDDRTVLVIPATAGTRFEGRVIVPEGESSPIPLAQLSVRIDQRIP